MTMTQWRAPASRPVPITTEPTRELQHIRDHLRGTVRTLAEHELDDYMDIVALLCEPLTLDEVAQRMGEGWTRRTIETRWENILEALCLKRRSGAVEGTIRVALVRQVYGIARCWCEF